MLQTKWLTSATPVFQGQGPGPSRSREAQTQQTLRDFTESTAVVDLDPTPESPMDSDEEDNLSPSEESEPEDNCTVEVCATASTSGTSLTSRANADAHVVQSFLDKLRPARHSDLTRKRVIRHNVRVRTKKPTCSTDPKSVTPSQRVKAFPNESLTVSAGKLFCTACREEVSLKQSIIKHHIAASKHVRGKQALAKKEARERDIVQAMKQYDKQLRPAGETLPEAQRVFRVKVLVAFLKSGVPIPFSPSV